MRKMCKVISLWIAVISFAFIITVALPNPVHADTIHSTFGEGGSYDTGSYFSINGSHVNGSETYTFHAAAASFTLSQDYSFDYASFAFAVRPTLETTEFEIRLTDALNGNPLETFLVTVDDPLAAGGNIYTISSLTHPTLIAGAQYWLEVNPASDDTFGVWYLNSEGLDGNVAQGAFPDSLHPTDYPTPAFSVGGTPVAAPEPSLSILLGIGIGVVFIAGWRL